MTPFFVAGLPRSGSTLLCNIIAQRADAVVTPTSPLCGVVQTLRDNWRQWHRATPEWGTDQRVLDVIRATITAYHKHPVPHVFDKNRSWVRHAETLRAIYGDSVKILAPVRPITQVVASMEKMWRRNIATGRVPAQLANDPEMQTVNGRVKKWLGGGDVIGSAAAALLDIEARGLSAHVMPVHFADLTERPQTTLNSIYEFLGIAPVVHDFRNVEQSTVEDDEAHGYTGLHTIRRDVQPVEDDSLQILGPELHKQLAQEVSWWMKPNQSFSIAV